MTKEMKIGAGLGLVLVIISSWFFISRSNDEQAVPLTGESAAADGAKPVEAAKKPDEKGKADAARPAAERRNAASRDTASTTPPRPAARPQSQTEESTARTASTTGTPPDAGAIRPPLRRPPLSPAETASPAAQPPSRSETVMLNTPGAAREAAPGTGTPTRPMGDAEGASSASPSEPGTAGSAPVSTTPRTANSREQSGAAPGIVPGIYPPRPGTNAAPTSAGTAPAQGTSGAQPTSSSASPEARGASAAAAGPTREHVVQSGDTFAGLAERYYGSQRHMGYLIAANKQIKDPGRLSIGQKLTIPPPPQGTEAKPAGAAKPITPTGDGRTYVVQAGDSFYDIAAKALGAGSRWPEIYERNKDVVGNNPANLTVGQVLELPPRE